MLNRGRNRGEGLRKGYGPGRHRDERQDERQGECQGECQREVQGRSLLDLQPGQRVQIRKICCRGAIRHRIMDMGLVPGAEVELVRYAPMGDPVVIRVCNYLLSLRKSEAREILI